MADTTNKNTLVTNSVQKLLFLVSGPDNEGIADTTNPLKSVFFGNTPVQNADGTFNINRVEFASRNGAASQDVIPGFTDASSAFVIATKVTTTTPYVYTATTSAIDAIRVTVRIPSLFEQDNQGNINGTTVSFKFEVKFGIGAYSDVRTITVNERVTTAFDLDYLISRPAGNVDIMAVRMTRITADNSATSKGNDTYFQVATEIQNVNLSYNNNSLVAIKTTAENAGSQLPIISFDWKGQKVRVPSNYTVSTRTYTGVWDQTFKASKEWCDNPAWFLLELLTNTTWGMGEFVDTADVDISAFYDAAVYCDALVPALDSNWAVSGTEPRFTLNYQFLENADPYQVIQNIAASFGAAIYGSIGGQITLLQERPTAYSRILGNSSVIGGGFEYTSTELNNRITACTVYWNNPDENWLSVPAYYEDTTAIARYGYILKELTIIGCTSRGQAMRTAKMVVESGISNTRQVTFAVGYKNAGIEVGEVVSIADSDFAEILNDAILVSQTPTSITLDKAVPVAIGNTFDVIAGDGTTIETRTITSAGTLSTINFSGAALTAIAGAQVIITGAISPQLFRIRTVTEETPGVYMCTGSNYDANKYARIDNTPVGPTPVYQVQPDGAVVSPPTSITFAEESYVDPEGKTHRFLTVRWSPAANQLITSYNLSASLNNATPIFIANLQQPYLRVEITVSGDYVVYISALNQRGKESLVASATHNINLEAPVGASSLIDVTNLYVVDTVGVAFAGTACAVQWVNPNVNTAGPVQKGYVVTVRDAGNTTTYRTENLAADALSYTYDLVKQEEDNPGAHKRSFIIKVQVQDTFNKLTTGTSATFTNAAPAVPANITMTGITSGLRLDYDQVTDADLKGYIIWYATSTGFSLTAANMWILGTGLTTTFSGLSGDTTYYYKIAAYDEFATQTDIETGTNLNVSAELNTATLSNILAYTVTTDVAAVTQNDSNAFSPSTINVYGWKTTGAGRVAYSGRFIIATSTDNITYTDRYTSVANETTKAWAVTPVTTAFIRVRLYAAGGTVTLLDEEIIPIVYDGAVGSAGANAVTIVVQNDKHTFATDSAGTISSYAGSGVTINAYEGANQLIYNTSLGVGAPGKFTVGTPTVITGAVTVGTYSSGAGTVNYITNNHSAMTTDVATIKWPITIWRFDGTYDSGTYYGFQSLAKSKQGTTGSTGSTGTTGAGARRAYAEYTGNPTLSGGPITRAGDPNTSVLYFPLPNALAGGTSFTGGTIVGNWQANTMTPSSGNTMFQSDGVYDPATGVTTWGTPYLSNFKVGTLSAIVADLGTITAGTITGATIRTAASGSRIELSSNTLKATNSGGSNLIEFDNTGKAVFTGGVYDPSGSTNYSACAARIGTATNLSALVGFYGYNELTAGGQAIKGESTSANASGIGVYGLASNSSSTGVYAQNLAGQALLTLGKVNMNLFTSASSELALHHTTTHIRMKTAVPGTTTGYGVLLQNDDTDFKIGVTASGSAESAASTTPLAIALSTGVVRVTKLRINLAGVTSGANTATFSGLLPTGTAASTNLWGEIDYNGTSYYMPIWAK